MSYIDIEYIIKRADEQELKEVTGSEDLSSSETVLQSIIDAEELVDEYLSTMYEVPLADAPATIKRVTFYVALYYIYSYRYNSETPESILNDYKWALEYLKEVSTQKKVINVDEKLDNGSVVITNKPATSKIFNSNVVRTIL